MGVLAALLILAAAAAEDDVPRIRALEAPGAQAYSLEKIQRIVRLGPGSALRRSPQSVAATLEDRYHIDGLVAARVTGAFDASSGTLCLSVVEGRLAEVAASGLSAKAGARALREAGLQTGDVLREGDVLAAWDRLEDASAGALTRGEHRIEPGVAGARLVLEPHAHRGSAAVSLAAFSGAGRKNSVDGWTQPLGVELTLFDRTRYNHTRAWARAAYATGPDDWRWHAGIERPFFAADRLVLGYQHHDVTDSDDAWRGVSLDEASGEAIWSDSFSRYYARRGDEAFAVVRLHARAQVGVNYRAERYASLSVTSDADERNPAVDEGRMRSVVASLRLETRRALFDDPGVERESYRLPSLFGAATAPPQALRLEATWEKAGDGLGGDFAFTRLVGVVRGRRIRSTRHHVDARLLAGRGSDLPIQKRFALGGIGTLRAYPLGAFPGDRMLVVNAEYGYELGSRLPRASLFYDGGDVWQHGRPAPGWKSGVGGGLRWPATGTAFLRLEWAWALSDVFEDRSRTLFRVQIPF